MESPMFIRFLVDALRQGTLRPDPRTGMPAGALDQAPTPAPQMAPQEPPQGILGTGGAGQAEQLLRRRRQQIDEAAGY